MITFDRLYMKVLYDAAWSTDLITIDIRSMTITWKCEILRVEICAKEHGGDVMIYYKNSRIAMSLQASVYSFGCLNVFGFLFLITLVCQSKQSCLQHLCFLTAPVIVQVSYQYVST